MPARYELKAGPDRQFLFHLKAANGEIILASEIYSSKLAALAAIESVRQNAAFDECFLRILSSRSQPFFVLRSADEGILGRSEIYTSDGAREKGIESVKKNGPIAGMRDLT